MGDPAIKLSKNEISSAFQGDAMSAYPPIMTTAQACEMLQIPRSTLAQWKTQGKFLGCHRRIGKSTRWWRDRLVESYFNGNV